MLSMTINAQFNLAVNPDALSGAPDIENTGNAVEEFWYHPINLIVGDMRVSVCDGSSPLFVWSLSPNPGAPGGMLYTSGQLPLPFKIKDPDVDLGEKGQNAMLVYELNGDIVLAAYRFDILSQGFHLISGPSIIGSGENPNLNVYSYVGNISYTIITWQDGNSIMACVAWGVATNTSTPVIVNAQNTGNTFSKPDATLKGSGIDPLGVPYDMLVSFTYIESSQTDGHMLIVQQETFENVRLGNIQYIYVNLGLNWLPVDDEYGHPRIASPWVNSLPNVGNYFDFSVVVDHFTATGEYQIESVTNNGGILSSGFNEPMPINYWNSNYSNPFLIETNTSVNNKPAIDYCGDNIVIAWQYFDDIGNIPAGLNTYEVLQRKLSLVGSPVYSSYSVVNFSSSGEEEFVSVAGRYSTQFNVLYTFSTDNSSLAFKYSDIGNINLRLHHEANMGVYPNPFTDVIYINLEAGDNHLSIYDMNCRLVYKYYTNSTSFNLDLSFLSKGLYILQIQSANSLQTKKIEKN